MFHVKHLNLYYSQEKNIKYLLLILFIVVKNAQFLLNLSRIWAKIS